MYNQIFLRRCVDIALLGQGKVAPNPMVGAVLVYQERIIGEGYHMAYGNSHAEVNALKSVRPEDHRYINKSTLYVSLEPCCIFGKTPPCTSLILDYQIPEVVIGVLDQTEEVAGKGVQLLQSKGVNVVLAPLSMPVHWISRIRNHFVQKNRPYVVLKLAQSNDGYMGYHGESTPISNPITKRLVHKWRNEFDAIMVGTNTAKTDNPKLTNRLFYGKSPVRVVLDKSLSLSKQFHLFDQSTSTIVFYQEGTPSDSKNIEYIYLPFDADLLSGVLNYLAKINITSVLVEGGPTLLNSFTEQNLWEEARIITNTSLYLDQGLQTPLIQGELQQQYHIQYDQIRTIYRNNLKVEKE